MANTTYQRSADILDTSALLHLLGQVALRAADNEPIEREWLVRQLDSTFSIDVQNQQVSHGPYLTVPEAYGRMRIGRSTFYELLRKRSLETVTIGARRMVPINEVDRFMTSHVGGAL